MRVGRLARHAARHALVDEAGAGRDRVGDVALDRVAGADRRGDAALRPGGGGAFADRRAGEDGDRPRRELQRAEEPGKPAADDDDVVDAAPGGRGKGEIMRRTVPLAARRTRCAVPSGIWAPESRIFGSSTDVRNIAFAFVSLAEGSGHPRERLVEHAAKHGDQRFESRVERRDHVGANQPEINRRGEIADFDHIDLGFSRASLQYAERDKAKADACRNQGYLPLKAPERNGDVEGLRGAIQAMLQSAAIAAAIGAKHPALAAQILEPRREAEDRSSAARRRAPEAASAPRRHRPGSAASRITTAASKRRSATAASSASDRAISTAISAHSLRRRQEARQDEVRGSERHANLQRAACHRHAPESALQFLPRRSGCACIPRRPSDPPP